MKSSKKYIVRLFLRWQQLWCRNKPDGDKNVRAICLLQSAVVDYAPVVEHIFHSEPEEPFSTKMCRKIIFPQNKLVG